MIESSSSAMSLSGATEVDIYPLVHVLLMVGFLHVAHIAQLHIGALDAPLLRRTPAYENAVAGQRRHFRIGKQNALNVPFWE